MSIVGGLLMGVVVFATLQVENPACRDKPVSLSLQLMGFGMFGGLVGSMIDSFLGATVQQTTYSVTSKKIIQGTSSGRPKGEVRTVRGYDWLTNNDVNMLSSMATAMLAVQLLVWFD